MRMARAEVCQDDDGQEMRTAQQAQNQQGQHVTAQADDDEARAFFAARELQVADPATLASNEQVG